MLNSWWVYLVIYFVISILDIQILVKSDDSGLFIIETLLLIIAVVVPFWKMVKYWHKSRFIMIGSSALIAVSAVIRFALIVSAYANMKFVTFDVLYGLLKLSLFFPFLIVVLLISDREEKWNEKIALGAFGTVATINNFFVTFLST